MNIINKPTGTQDEIIRWFKAALDEAGKTFSQALDHELYFNSKYPYEDNYIRYEDYFLELISSTGGYEGAGTYTDVILGIKHNIKNEYLGYLKFVGVYNSWDYGEWKEYYPVQPEEVTIIQYTEY